MSRSPIIHLEGKFVLSQCFFDDAGWTKYHRNKERGFKTRIGANRSVGIVSNHYFEKVGGD